MATSPSERGGGRLAPRERRRHRRQRGGDAAIRLTPVRAPSPPSTAAGSNAVRGPGPPQGGAAEELPLAAGHPLPLGEGGGQAAAPHHCYLSARTRERGREGGRGRWEGGRRPRSVRTPEALVTHAAALGWVGTRGRRPAVTNSGRQRGGARPSPAARAAAGAGRHPAAPWRGVSGNKLLPALSPLSPPFLPPRPPPLLVRFAPGGARSAFPLPAAGRERGHRPPLRRGRARRPRCTAAPRREA